MSQTMSFLGGIHLQYIWKHKTFLAPGRKMELRIQKLLLNLFSLLSFNILVETTDFAEQVREIEKEIEAIEPVQNVAKAEEIREHLNQFYKETCSPTEAVTYRSYFTPNVRVNTGGKRVS